MDIGPILCAERSSSQPLGVRSNKAGLTVLSLARPFGELQVQAGWHWSHNYDKLQSGGIILN